MPWDRNSNGSQSAVGKISPQIKPKQELIYGPGELKQLCEEAGAWHQLFSLYNKIFLSVITLLKKRKKTKTGQLP